ncbi:hypothetical protein ACFT4A_33960 [Streptomyces sp. NPDC057099]|uniref:hypothetical protein n=1 Tax=Streptomyces sp. NPDC057099 TaxID=3346019 RepID=UPI00363BFCBD
MRTANRALPVLVTALISGVVVFPASAYAFGTDEDHPPGKTPVGDASGNTLTAEATDTRIKVTQVSGGTSGAAAKALAPVDPNWHPPACWYEPVATPEQLKNGVELLEQGRGASATILVTPSLGWGPDLMVDHYKKGAKQSDGYESYKNFNLGKAGSFWRGVVNESRKYDPEAYNCDKLLFWQDAGALPDNAHAPTPDILASYAYDEIKVPDTEVELKPAVKSTVNLPTWVWLDKAAFKEVQVRAELEAAGVWAETTAKPIALHLEPGTEDAETYPASGDCRINDDGSIGTPYASGEAGKTPPCGIRYLRASNGQPYQLTASITWQISWEGSGGAQGDLPDGTFETKQDMTVQEIQAVNR